MNDLFRDFEDLFELGFGFPKDLKFNTCKTKDMMPACWKVMTKEKDGKDGYKCVCRTVGISEKDVTVALSTTGITVEGKTEYEGEEYNTHFELPIAESILADIVSIDYKTLNGLTYIYLNVKKPEQKKVTIRKI